MFENKLIRGIHVSRYVASWINVGGKINRYRNKTDPGKRRIENNFADWLRELVIDGEHLTEDEVRYISNYATNGKLELEHEAESYLRFGKCLNFD